MSRRFLIDHDGDNLFGQTLSDDIEQSIADVVTECPEIVTTYMVCCNTGKFLYPTRVGDVVADSKSQPAAHILREAHRRGKDPFGMFLKALRQSGKETFITYRMNDVHDPESPDGWNTSTFKKNHPDYVVDYQAVKSKKADWMSYCLDYSRPEVQEYILATIAEIVERYEMDGLQLDWMRFPRHLSGNPQEVWDKRELITQFTVKVRNLLDKTGRKMLLSARIPTNPAGCRYLGMDIAGWTRQKLVDFLIPSPFLTTDFSMPLQELKQLMGEHQVPLYACMDMRHGGPQHHCPESLKAAALSLFNCGADGIYLFNIPIVHTEYLAARPYHWLKGIQEPGTAAEKPLLFSIAASIPNVPRIPNIDLPGQLPVSLPVEKAQELTIDIPSPAFPVNRALFLVHSHGDIALSLNGQELPEIPFLRNSEIFVEYISRKSDDQMIKYRPEREDCRVFRVNPLLLKSGINVIALANRAGHDLTIDRVNLGIW